MIIGWLHRRIQLIRAVAIDYISISISAFTLTSLAYLIINMILIALMKSANNFVPIGLIAKATLSSVLVGLLIGVIVYTINFIRIDLKVRTYAVHVNRLSYLDLISEIKSAVLGLDNNLYLLIMTNSESMISDWNNINDILFIKILYLQNDNYHSAIWPYVLSMPIRDAERKTCTLGDVIKNVVHSMVSDIFGRGEYTDDSISILNRHLTLIYECEIDGKMTKLYSTNSSKMLTFTVNVQDGRVFYNRSISNRIWDQHDIDVAIFK